MWRADDAPVRIGGFDEKWLAQSRKAVSRQENTQIYIFPKRNEKQAFRLSKWLALHAGPT